MKEIYSDVDSLCKRGLGKVYDYRFDKLYDVGCGRFDCARCRPRLKFNLFMEVLRWIYIYNLNKHFIITFEGKRLRDKIGWDASFMFMNKEWDKFLKMLRYHYGDITYILFPRAQQSGYCHYHIITNNWIDWKFLEEKRKNYDFGWMRIKHNKSVAEYLNRDYFKDHEWVIPKGIRHFRSSRNIKLNKYKAGEGSIYYTRDTSVKFIEYDIGERFSRMLPFEEYVKQFVELQKKKSI